MAENITWTAERVGIFRALHAEGLSYSKIGAKLGISRCAACTKARRLRLPPRKHSAKSQLVRFFEGPTKFRPAKFPRKCNSSKGIPFDKLRATHCKWPLGDAMDPPLFFCGGERVKGKPYCRAHVQRAYRPYTPPVFDRLTLWHTPGVVTKKEAA